MMSTLDVFVSEKREENVVKNVYVTTRLTFEKYCKGCRELVRSEQLKGEWVRVFCKAEKCVK